MDYLEVRGPYLLHVVLLVAGIGLILSHRNVLNALVGLFVFQSGVILFFIVLAARRDGTLPIVDPEVTAPSVDPLPHALMLTAIVVGVATLGVGLAILHKLQEEHGTLDERRDDDE